MHYTTIYNVSEIRDVYRVPIKLSLNRIILIQILS